MHLSYDLLIRPVASIHSSQEYEPYLKPNCITFSICIWVYKPFEMSPIEFKHILTKNVHRLSVHLSVRLSPVNHTRIQKVKDITFSICMWVYKPSEMTAIEFGHNRPKMTVCSSVRLSPVNNDMGQKLKISLSSITHWFIRCTDKNSSPVASPLVLSRVL